MRATARLTRPEKPKSTAIEAIVADILAGAGEAGSVELAAWKKPKRDLQRLARLDYVRVMRRTLGFHELHALVREAKKVWPHINREQLRVGTDNERVKIASGLSVQLQEAPYEGREGMALRGFYVNHLTRQLKRPLIYLNTAHHPGAVAATFAHEMGHHVMSRAIRSDVDGIHFFFGADYHSHLSDPVELAADAVVSLAAYPEPLARKLFASPWNWGLVARAGLLPDQAIMLVQEHIKKLTGIDFRNGLPPGQSFHYLAGMIHYAKLRWALLAEYEI